MPVSSPTPLTPNDKYHYTLGGQKSNDGDFVFEYKGALYCFGSGVPDVNYNPFTLSALKSTDGGASWSILDSSHQPLSNPGDTSGFADSWTCALDGSKVYFVCVKYNSGSGTGTPSIVSFDLDTALWGLEVNLAAPVLHGLNPAQININLSRRGAGDMIFFFCGDNTKHAYYAPFDGSIFGASVIIPGQDGPDGLPTYPYGVVGSVVDSSGTMHFIFGQDVGAAHISLLKDGSFGSIQHVLDADITPLPPYYAKTGPSAPKIINLGGERIAFAALGVSNADSLQGAILFCSAPIATDPIWTITPAVSGVPDDLMPDRGGNWPVWNGIDVTQSGRTIAIVWTHTLEDESGLDTGQWWETHSINGKTWTPYSVLFQTPPASPTQAHGWAAEQTHLAPVTGGVGIWGTSGDVFGDAAGGPYWQVQYALLPLPPPPVAQGGSHGRFQPCCISGHKFQAVHMMEMVRRSRRRQADWPYIHCFAPPGSLPVNEKQIVAAPAANVLTPILLYRVPSGMRFYLREVLADFDGAQFLPGDALFTLDRNQTIPNVQGAVVQGLVQWPVPLGSVAEGIRWKLPRAYEFEPLEIVRWTVTNVNLGEGSGQFTGGLFGYLVPDVKGAR